MTPKRLRHVLSTVFLLCAFETSFGAKLPGPLLPRMGDLHHEITTDNRLAQRYFNQGMVLMYGFNHNEAIRSFQSVVALDPDCAMGYWGIAICHGPNINRPMTAEDVPRAWAALERALSHRDAASPGEKAYIEALAGRYAKEPPEDRSPLDQAYVKAMRDLASQFPDDLDAHTLFAEALMDTMPWNYWTPEKTPRPETEELLDTLRYVLRRNPDHPGANHYYIHAVEAGPTPEIGLPSADRLRELELGAGHLVHMPSHIYLRVGQYRDATMVNERASRVDRAYINHCKVQGFYPGGYYPHNLQFLWYAASVEGRSKSAIKTAHKVVEYELDNRCGPTPVMEAPRFRHLHLLAWARFGKWDLILSAPHPGETFNFDLAMWHYARGLAYIATDQTKHAIDAGSQLHQLANNEQAAAENTMYFPGSTLLQVADHVLAGKLAAHRKDGEQEIARLKKAIEHQDTLAYMEPPYWYYPVRQSLGAAYLRQNKPAEAERAFREDLQEWPRNGWSLFGLRESLERQNKTVAAQSVQSQFEQAWERADTDLDLSWF